MSPTDSVDNQSIRLAVKCLRAGGVIAYPTESVYGLGCDPMNSAAVQRLSVIKDRPEHKGFIIIAAGWTQVQTWVRPIEPRCLQPILQANSRPVTWIFPAMLTVPTSLCGPGHSIAIRFVTHPIMHALCEAYGGPIISTSANRHHESPIRDPIRLREVFQREVDVFVLGRLGSARRPSEIRDMMTGVICREG